MQRSLPGVRTVLSVLGGLIGLLGLSVVGKKVARAARTFYPPPAIHIVGPEAAGKTTLFHYLCHTPSPGEAVTPVAPRQRGRLAADFSEGRRLRWRSRVTDDGLGGQTSQWAGRLKRYNPEGMIVVMDTHTPDDDQAYVQALYASYRDFSAGARRVKLRVLLVLLNKFDLWGSTTASREAVMQRYRTEVLSEVVNQFRSRFGVSVQFGYASLTRPEHAPYNRLTVEGFLTALNQRPPA